MAEAFTKSITDYVEENNAVQKAIHLNSVAASSVITSRSDETLKISEGVLAIPGTKVVSRRTRRRLRGDRIRLVSVTCRKRLQSSFGDESVSVRSKKRKKHSFTFAELFAGIGGFRLGLEQLGGSCVFASEIDREVRSIYAHNF